MDPSAGQPPEAAPPRLLRILHLTDRLTDRGGAYRHLLGVVAEVEAGHEVWVAGGTREQAVAWPCPTRVAPGLEARTRTPVALDELERALAPDIVHAHTVTNPGVLEWAGARRAVVTVQDHRYFCPARGKWTAQGERCRKTLQREACAACFDDAAYFEEVGGLTRARLQAVRRLHVVVLSRYMRRQRGVHVRGRVDQAGRQPHVGGRVGRGGGHDAALQEPGHRGVRPASAAAPVARKFRRSISSSSVVFSMTA